MKKITLIILIGIGLACQLTGQAFNIEHLYPIETIHSYFEFETTYMGYAKVRGNFGNFYGSVYYNPEDPSQTSVTFRIDVESIDTNNDWRDKDLKSGNWFLAEQFPHINFTSKRVQADAEGLQVNGDLTIKETTKNISFVIAPAIGVIKDMRGDHQVIFTGSYTLNRKEFGIMGKNWSQVKEGIAALSDEVTISFSLLGKQMKADNFKNFLRNEKRPPGAIYAAYKTEGLEGAIKRFEVLKNETEVKPDALTRVAYMLLQQDKDKEAMALMELNQKEFPEDANAHDLRAEIYAKMGDFKKAKEAYQKSLALDPNNMNAAEALKHFE